MLRNRLSVLLGAGAVLAACGTAHVDTNGSSARADFADCESTVTPLQDVAIPVDLRDDVRALVVQVCSIVQDGGLGVPSRQIALGDTHLACFEIDAILTAANVAGMPTVATPGDWRFGGLRYHISAGLSERDASSRRWEVQQIFRDWLTDGGGSNVARFEDVQRFRMGCDAIYRANQFTDVPLS